MSCVKILGHHANAWIVIAGVKVAGSFTFTPTAPATTVAVNAAELTPDA
jgi:hypothetical protein